MDGDPQFGSKLIGSSARTLLYAAQQQHAIKLEMIEIEDPSLKLS